MCSYLGRQAISKADFWYLNTGMWMRDSKISQNAAVHMLFHNKSICSLRSLKRIWGNLDMWLYIEDICKYMIVYGSIWRYMHGGIWGYRVGAGWRGGGGRWRGIDLSYYSATWAEMPPAPLGSLQPSPPLGISKTYPKHIPNMNNKCQRHVQWKSSANPIHVQHMSETCPPHVSHMFQTCQTPVPAKS